MSCLVRLFMTRVGEIGASVQENVVTESLYENVAHTHGATIDCNWLEVHQRTHCLKIGSSEDEINEVWTKTTF